MRTRERKASLLWTTSVVASIGSISGHLPSAHDTSGALPSLLHAAACTRSSDATAMLAARARKTDLLMGRCYVRTRAHETPVRARPVESRGGGTSRVRSPERL